LNNIAFIIPSLSGGGAERVVSNLSKAVPEDHNKIIIIYHEKDNPYEHDGTVINLGIEGSDNLFFKTINTIKRLKKIKDIKKNYSISKTYSFLDNPNLLNVLSMKKDEAFVSIRNQQSLEFKGLKKIIHKFVVNKLYTKAKFIVAISNGVKQDLIDNFNVDEKKIKVIHNPVDVAMVDRLKTKDSITKGTNPTIVTAGRLENQKGQWHLIRAFKKVVDFFPDATLQILGEGSLKKSLETLAEELGIRENIQFVGFQSNPYKYIYKADVFVLTSLYEGFGNVILEAMACGVPVISTDCKSGPREIIAPDTPYEKLVGYEICEYGILTPTPEGDNFNSIDSLTSAETSISESMIHLLNDDELKKSLSKKSTLRINDFKPGHIIKKWLEM
jgi:glycosyltransferase involved in cell wall biosynthesis